MKNRSMLLLSVVFAGAASLMTGCKPASPEDQNPPASTNTVATTAQSVKDFATAAVTNTVNATTQAWADVKASFQSAMDYSYDKKDEFVAKTSADMKVLDQKIQNLSDKAATATDATKASLQNDLQDLKDKRGVLDAKMAKVKDATEADWQDAKAGFQNAYDDVKTSLKNGWHTLTGS